MVHLLDAGDILRLANVNDPLHGILRRAIGVLGDRGESVVIFTQNIAEFAMWSPVLSRTTA